MYAVIEVQGKQYRVAEGDSILVDGVDVENPQVKVLMLNKGNDVVTDLKALGSASVSLTADGVVTQRLNRAAKYKPKQGSSCKRLLGHRRRQTRFQVGAIKA